jgi:hypothetical protein
MKKLLVSIATATLVAAVGLGWYFGHTRPAIRTMSLVREAGASDEDIIRMYRDMQQILADHRQDFLSSAALSVNVLSALEEDDIEKAEKWLVVTISGYYQMYLADTPDQQLDESRRKLKRRIEALIQRNDKLRAGVEGKKSKEG